MRTLAADVRSVRRLPREWLRTWVGRASARVAHTLRRAAAEALDALFPRLCGVCGDAGDGGPWCAAHRLPAGTDAARCATCAARLPRALEAQPRCAECRRRSSGLARVVVLSDYRDAALRDWILAFKHGGRSELAAPLGAALAAHVERHLGWSVERLSATEAGRAPTLRVLCPVPLHAWRRLERGYDQARLLGEVLAADLGVPLAPLLARVRPTAVQGAGGARSRKANVRGAFALRRGLRDRVLRRGAEAARRVLAEADEVWLVDDVVTSGATLRECARALRRGGAKRVGALALARAVGRKAPSSQDGEPALGGKPAGSATSDGE
jgi:predicted amidophosphoribosyltransferase